MMNKRKAVCGSCGYVFTGDLPGCMKVLEKPCPNCGAYNWKDGDA